MMRPLVETYVASLPATRARESWRDLGATPPAGVVQTTVRKGIAPKSEVSIVFSGPFEDSRSGQLALRTAATGTSSEAIPGRRDGPQLEAIRTHAMRAGTRPSPGPRRASTGWQPETGRRLMIAYPM